MKFLQLNWVWKRWAGQAVNQNTPDGHVAIFRRYQSLMDQIDPVSPQSVLDCATLAKAILGRNRETGQPDEATICLQAFILVVALHAEKTGRTLLTVRALIVDPDAFLGTLIMIGKSTGPTADFLRLFGRRLGLWSKETLADVTVAVRRHLTFVPAPGE